MSSAYFKAIAEEDYAWAERSTRCLRKGTAARLINPTGHFWRAKNHPVIDCTNQTGRCGCAHAEPRVIAMAIGRIRREKMTLVVTLSPCTACANLIASLKFIHEVYYLRPLFHDPRGLQILDAAGIWRQHL